MATISLHGDCRHVRQITEVLRAIAKVAPRPEIEIDAIFLTFAKAVRDRTDPYFDYRADVTGPWAREVMRTCERTKIQMHLRPSDPHVSEQKFYFVNENGNVISFDGKHPNIPIHQLTHICGLPPGRGISLLRNMVSELRMAAGQGLPPFNPSEHVKDWVFAQAAKQAIGLRNVFN